MKIFWTPKALEGLDEVINYLELHWTPKELGILEENIKKIKRRVKQAPFIYPSTYKSKF